MIKAEQKGKLPKILVPVHLCGLPCDMKKIHQLAKKYQFKIIEDASHAHGASVRGIKAGNFGDISVFSLHQRKALSVGDGGVVCTSNENFYNNTIYNIISI